MGLSIFAEILVLMLDPKGLRLKAPFLMFIKNLQRGLCLFPKQTLATCANESSRRGHAKRLWCSQSQFFDHVSWITEIQSCLFVRSEEEVVISVVNNIGCCLRDF